MRVQRTSVGLDVHALSVVACGIDEDTGEVFRRRLSPDYGEALAWLRTLPSAVKVVYEAGPTGFGLCRALTAAAVECVVVAASKLQRPAGDRIKTDARDALHLARLLQLSEIVEVSVPSVEQEAARDLVRAREDARGGLDAVPASVVETTAAAGPRLFRWGGVDRCSRRMAARTKFRPTGTSSGVLLGLRGDDFDTRTP